MANGKATSLDDMLRESRQKRKAQEMAQEIFGKRSKTPATRGGAKPAHGASLASRVGVGKRTASLPRSNTAPPRNPRPQSNLNRPPLENNYRARPSAYAPPPASSDPVSDVKSNGYAGYDAPAANGSGPGVSIRGAAAGPHIVIASNFAPGTTAADIESVMLDVGGQMTDCRLVATTPTVMAEMTFVEKSGAETVINTFNNKKADGRTLHVYWKSTGTGTLPLQGQEAEPVAEPMVDTMEVDQNAESREAENRLREERRGRPERGPRESFPTGPRNDRPFEDDHYRGPRRAEPAYQDGRYGFNGGDRYGGGRGRYRDEGRMYSDRMGRGGQSWRP